MLHLRFLTIMMVAFTLISCSGSTQNFEVASEKVLAEKYKQDDRSKYLAYEHYITLEVAAIDLQTIFEQINTFCDKDVQNRCTVLNSSIDTGDYPSASLRARVKPEGASGLLKAVSSKGKVSNQSTTVEDLQDAMIDGDKRLEMLLQYQRRLESLEQQSIKNVEALIKVSKELAQVQSDIEYAQGEKAKLLQRVETDIVNISLRTNHYTSFWQPISKAFSRFGKNLSTGIAEALEALAYSLPWILLITGILFIIRVIWVKTKAR